MFEVEHSAGNDPEIPESSPAPAARPKRSRPALVADLFCGAGGSSTGARKALERRGIKMKLVAVNHWPIAIETHQKNHPDARHYCVNLDAARPEEIVPEGHLDLLMASPECTHHSRARGGRPVNDQSRMSAWHVVRWCTALRVRRILIENVPEFADWGPVNRQSGIPVRSRKGEYFKAWVKALEAIGFKIEFRVLNAADYGDATTRERLFLVGRTDRKPIRWPAPSHSRDGSGDLFGNGAQRWRAAREIIDWSIVGRSIFDRKRPLAPKTLARIYAGAVKFRWPEPFLVVLRQHMAGRSIDDPLPTITAGGSHIGLAQPFLLNRHGDNGATRAHDLAGPVPTADCRGAGYLVEPFVLGQGSNSTARSVEEPTPTATTVARIGLVEPFIATVAHGNEAHERSPDARRVRSLDEPLQTIHAGGGKFALVEPFVLSQHAGGAPRSLEDPMPGMTCDGAHALIAPYYGSGSGETCGSVENPLPTCTAKARFGIVMPVTHGDDSNRARSLEEPVPTITCARRGELAFITAAFGEREGQAPRVHSVEEPTPTICAQGRVNLVQPGRDFDILFRMLDPTELAAAMGFSDEEAAYEFAGNKTEVTKQIGNAVPVNTAAALVGALFSE